MGILRLIRRIFKILQSELTPGQIGAGFVLGAFMGLAPLGLHSLLLVSLALLFRLSFSSFLISAGLFKIFYLPLRGVSHLIGGAILEWPQLEPLWQTVLQWPVIAPLGFNRYLLFGSYALSSLIAIPLFFLVRAIVTRYRRSFVRFAESSGVYRRLGGQRWFRALRWLLAGGEAKFLRPRRRGLFRYLRREMLVGLPLLYLAAYLLAGAIVPFFTTAILTRAGTVLVGSEVAVEQSRFNLFTGRLTVEGLTVQNPQAREEDVMVVSELVVDVGILPLLSKKIIFNEGSIRELQFNVRREPDGSLNIDNFERGWEFEPYLRWLREEAAELDWFKLFRRYIEQRRERPPQPKPPPLLGAKSLQPRGPSFTLEQLGVDRLQLTLRDDYRGGALPRITGVDVVLENLSIDSRLGRRPIRLGLEGRLEGGGSFTLEGQLDYRREPAVREYKIEVKKLDLPAFAPFYATSLPVEILSGKLTVTTELTIAGEEVRAKNNVLLEDLELARSGDSLFGLDPATSQKAIEGLNRYGEEFPLVLGFLIDGTTAAPRFHWEKPLLEAAQKGLMLLGRRELQHYIDRLGLRLERLGEGESPLELEEGFAQIQQAVQELIASKLSLPDEGIVEELEALQGLLERLLGNGGEGTN